MAGRQERGPAPIANPARTPFLPMAALRVIAEMPGGAMPADLKTIGTRFHWNRRQASETIARLTRRKLLARDADRPVLSVTPKGWKAVAARKPVQQAKPPPSNASGGDDGLRYRAPLSKTQHTQLKKQRSELRTLATLRDVFLIDIAAMGVDLDRLYDSLELGQRIGFTVEEDERFATEALGRKEGWYKRKGKIIRRPAKRFPASFIPAGFSKPQTKQRRHMFNLPRKAADAKRRRAAVAAERAARVQMVGDLDCRASAIDAVITDEFQTIVELMMAVADSPAFRRADGKAPLTGGSLKKAVQRELKKAVLAGRIETRRDRYRNGRPMDWFRRRQ